MRLTWALRGAALCSQHQFLNDFRWRWDVPETCRSKDASRFMRVLWEALPKLDAFLHREGADSDVLWAQDGWSFVATQYEDQTYLSFDKQHGAPNPSHVLSLACEPSANTKLFFSGSSNAGFLEEFGPDARQTLSKVLGRLGIGKQAAARATPTLFVIVWHVPLGTATRLRPAPGGAGRAHY